jgi:hypothetical protein
VGDLVNRPERFRYRSLALFPLPSKAVDSVRALGADRSLEGRRRTLANDP